MNVRPSPKELDRVRTTIGAALRLEDPPATERAPETLLALLKDLKTSMLDKKREKIFVEVDERIADLMRACREG
jgi:hypothetical protein